MFGRRNERKGGGKISFEKKKKQQHNFTLLLFPTVLAEMTERREGRTETEEVGRGE
jgi:hypothetical protein